jgi:protein-disulfide isomerase
VEAIVVRTLDEAQILGFRGSPTVLVNGLDVEPDPPAGTGLG